MTTTPTNSIVTQTVPIGSLWMRTKGKHSGRQVKVQSTSNLGIKLELIGRQYTNSHGAGRTGSATAHVPYDMFLLLYKPEDPTYPIPTRADIHLWHIENSVTCNCPKDVRLLAETKLVANSVVKPQPKPAIRKQPTSTPIPTPTPTPIEELPTIVSTSADTDNTDILLTQSTPSPSPSLDIDVSIESTSAEPSKTGGRRSSLNDETLQLLAYFFRDNPTISVDTMCKEFGVSTGTIYRANKKFGIPPRRFPLLSKHIENRTPEEQAQVEQYKAGTRAIVNERHAEASRLQHEQRPTVYSKYFWTPEQRAKQSERAKARWAAARQANSAAHAFPTKDVELSVTQPQPTEATPITTTTTTATVQRVTTPSLTIPASPLLSKWRVTIIKEVVVEVEAHDYLDAGVNAGEGEVIRIERL